MNNAQMQQQQAQQVPVQLTNAQMQQMQAPQMQQQMQVPQMQMNSNVNNPFSNNVFTQQQQVPQMQMNSNVNPFSNAVFTPQQAPMRSQNVRGGMYGSRQAGNYAQDQIFNDDEPLG